MGSLLPFHCISELINLSNFLTENYISSKLLRNLIAM